MIALLKEDVGLCFLIHPVQILFYYDSETHLIQLDRIYVFLSE